MTPMFGGYGVSEPGQLTQAPVSPMARALNNLAAAMLYKRDIEQANREREQQKQQFEMQQKLQEEQLKSSQLQQKQMQQSIDAEQKRMQYDEMRNKTTPRQILMATGLTEADIAGSGYTPELLDMPIGGMPEAVAAAWTKRAFDRTAPEYVGQLNMMKLEGLRNGMPKQMFVSMAKDTHGYYTEEELAAEWEGYNMSPDKLAETLNKAIDLEMKMLPMLTTSASRLEDLRGKLDKEKDPAKKKDIENKIKAEESVLNSVPDMFMEQYKGSPFEVTMRNVLYDSLWDEKKLAAYPEMMGMLKAREEVSMLQYMARFAPRSGGGGGGGGGGSKPRFSITTLNLAAQLGDENLFNAELSKLYAAQGSTLVRGFTAEDIAAYRANKYKPETPKEEETGGSGDAVNNVLGLN